jgi:hypothetical protein
MNTTNNKSLFWLAAKKEYQDNRKLILWGCLGWLSLCIIAGSMLGYLGVASANRELGVYFIFINIATAVATSLAFSDMKHKEGRIAAIMTPAKAIHKFMPRFLAMVVGLYIVFIIGYFFLDYTRVIINGLVNPVAVEPLQISFDIDRYSAAALAVTISSMLLAQACYLLGGVLAPKASFFKTTAILFIAEFLIGALYGVIKSAIHIHLTITPLALAYTIADVMFALTILLWWCAYRAFKKCKVTPFMIRIGKHRYEF